MAQKEIVSVLKIETGQSENTIKALKSEIAQLKKSLETAEIGSEEFAKASRDLATAQANLKTVMADGKRTTDAVEGSYNHLVATMAELKKQWKATADEAKRNEIGKQIDEINTKLKNMDATIGNHQRNVGNYKGDIIEAFDEMGGSVKSYGERWSEMQKSTEETRAKFESVQKMASGLASGFAAVQGAAALFGAENENLQKTLVKVQSAMAIAQGIGGLKDLIEGFTQAKTAFAGATMGLKAMETQTVTTAAAVNGAKTATIGATTAVKGLRGALISTGVGAILVGIGVAIAAIASNWDKISKMWSNTDPQKKAAKESRELTYELNKLANQSAAEKIVRVRELANAYANLGDNLDEKKKFVAKYSEELENMGIKMTDVNDAEKVFYEYTDEYCNAIMARAKADAARQKATEDYQKALDGINEAEKAAAEKEAAYDNAKSTEDTADDAIDKVISVVTAGFPESAAMQRGAAAASSAADDAYKEWQAAESKVQRLKEKANAEMKKLFDFAAEQDKLANQWLTAENQNGNGSGGSSSSSSSSSSSTDDPAAEAKRIAERAKQALIDTKEEELAELRRIYKEELALLQQHNIATGDLTKEFLDKETELLKEIEKFEGGNEQEQLAALENFYNERIRIYTEAGVSTVELTAQFEAEKNDIIEYYENQRQEALTQIANDSKTEKELEIQELTEQYNTYLELFKDHKEQLLLVEKWYQNQMDAITERYKDKKDEDEDDKDKEKENEEKYKSFIASYGALFVWIEEKAGKTAANVAVSFVEALNSASQIIGALQAGIDTTEKDGFEKNKKYQIAQASINIAQGILAAISSAMMMGPIMGPIMGAINAGTVATVGGIQIANIKKQTFNGSNSGDIGNLNGVGATPNVSMDSLIPINYTRSLMTDTETTEMNKGNRIYVVESDVTETQDRVKVKETNSSF